MLGVAFVVTNRMTRGRWLKANMSLKEVALQPWQFSCFNQNDPNRARLLDIWRTDPASWERADTVCDLLESGLVLDPTLGSTHYVVSSMWNQEPKRPDRPQWYEAPEIESGRTRFRIQLGHHIFAVAP